VFNNYVKRDGYEKARTYSAIPGTSEHQTGLSIDVSGSNGYCAVSSCFAGTKEAKWLDKNSANFGYIIRYPKGKEHVTGYKYEPWHIRYVGTGIAKDMKARGLTLEEYFGIFPILK
jgi:zinc D-Ala-D-Ala carboxypeptidase